MAPINLPNSLIYFISLLRPAHLRPDLKVASVARIDFRGLKKRGFNAVVIDKDNCLTVPYRDEVYPPYKAAWEDLVSVFKPGSVLVVSNSAGTKKDPGGIAAEALSLSLKIPVLLHPTPKPSCASLVLSYFQSTLGKPRTLRQAPPPPLEKAVKEEEADEKELLENWRGEVENGLLLGNLERKATRKPGTREGEGNGKDGDGYGLERRMNEAEKSGRKDVIKPSSGDQAQLPSSPETSTTSTITSDTISPPMEDNAEPLKIMIIGDRLFTDTLLAHRLSLHLPPTSGEQHVISIQTTSLPQRNDVRALRWLEDKLSGGRLKSGKVDWGRYVLDQPVDSIRKTNDVGVGESTKYISTLQLIRSRFSRSANPTIPKITVPESTLTLNPQTWTPRGVLAAVGRSVKEGLIWTGRTSWNGLKALYSRILSSASQRRSDTSIPEKIAP